jgi:hypothetical protein
MRTNIVIDDAVMRDAANARPNATKRPRKTLNFNSPANLQHKLIA